MGKFKKKLLADDSISVLLFPDTLSRRPEVNVKSFPQRLVSGQTGIRRRHPCLAFMENRNVPSPASNMNQCRRSQDIVFTKPAIK